LMIGMKVSRARGMRSNRLFDADTASRTDERTPRRAIPQRAGQLRR
jgi:hypothetical protein